MSKTYVVEHIKDIYEKGKLDGCSTCRDFRQIQQESQRLLNLEFFLYLNMICCSEFLNY